MARFAWAAPTSQVLPPQLAAYVLNREVKNPSYQVALKCAHCAVLPMMAYQMRISPASRPRHAYGVGRHPPPLLSTQLNARWHGVHFGA